MPGQYTLAGTGAHEDGFAAEVKLRARAGTETDGVWRLDGTGGARAQVRRAARGGSEADCAAARAIEHLRRVSRTPRAGHVPRRIPS